MVAHIDRKHIARIGKAARDNAPIAGRAEQPMRNDQGRGGDGTAGGVMDLGKHTAA